MSTEAQIRANQQNAQKSTGPKTEAGKARSAQNARIHGFCAQSLIFPLPAERDLFLARCQELTVHYDFDHPLQQSLITALATAEAQIRFVNLAKRGIGRAIIRQYQPNTQEIEPTIEMVIDSLGAALLQNPSAADTLAKLNRYEVEQRRLFYKAFQQLEALSRTVDVSRRPATTPPPPHPETNPILKPKNPPKNTKHYRKAA